MAPSPFAGALEMAAAIRDGGTTSRELVEMHIERIERLDVKVNAVVLRTFEEARKAADAADARTKEGKPLGIFHGVPMTLKEGMPTVGLKVTTGMTAMAELPPSAFTHKIAERMINAGAILLGKTNVPTAQFDWDSANPVYGATHNPYDLTRTPGGSSGGSAASLAAGFAALEIGSDVAGSIRVPSALCGLVGHVATLDVVPRMWDQAWMPQYGPMGRNAEDVAAMLRVIGGETADALPKPEKASLAEYSVAVWRTHNGYEPSAEILHAIQKTVDVLQAAGAAIDDLVLPMKANESLALYLKLLGAELHPAIKMFWPGKAQVIAALHKKPIKGRGVWNNIDVGMVFGHTKEGMESRQDACALWEQCLSRYDAVLCPIVLRDAWPHVTSANANFVHNEKVGSRPLEVDGTTRRYDTNIFWQHIPKLCGLPATVFPAGKSHDGLPIGLQVIGKSKSDLTLLDLVGRLMHELGTDRFQPPGGFEDARSRL